jgi:hypothetical protein
MPHMERMKASVLHTTGEACYLHYQNLIFNRVSLRFRPVLCSTAC